MLKLGHRGASGQLPENSLAAFRRAMELGADGVELDMQGCAGGGAIVLHDETLERTVQAEGRADERTLEQLESLKLRGLDEPPPQLPDVIHALGRQAYIFIELKTRSCAGPVAEVMGVFQRRGYERLVAIGFDAPTLRDVKTRLPGAALGLSFEKIDEQSVAEAKKLGATYILPHHAHVTAELVAQAHQAGLKLVAWTVNEPADIARLAKLGVDGLIGDYPERFTS